jgi:type I restriction enzyme S subunit
VHDAEGDHADALTGLKFARQIPLPALPERRSIARQLHQALAWIDRIASQATNARKLIDHLDQAVLAKAFRGELVPQDPKDEPASVMLERIRAERNVRAASDDAKRPRRGTGEIRANA